MVEKEFTKVEGKELIKTPDIADGAVITRLLKDFAVTSRKMDVDYFQSAALGSDFTTTTTTPVFEDTGVTVSFTAPSAGLIIFVSNIAAKHTQVGANADFRIYDSGSGIGIITSDTDMQSENKGYNLAFLKAVSSGSHVFNLYVKNYTTGTLTLEATDITRTRIEGIFFGT